MTTWTPRGESSRWGCWSVEPLAAVPPSEGVTWLGELLCAGPSSSPCHFTCVMLTQTESPLFCFLGRFLSDEPELRTCRTPARTVCVCVSGFTCAVAVVKNYVVCKHNILKHLLIKRESQSRQMARASLGSYCQVNRGPCRPRLRREEGSVGFGRGSSDSRRETTQSVRT